ncbi:MAG: M20/M25/M40 family metallo-hydrolase [Actinomycetota bacterium]|nr:M20/M25/M40 family metallo-hydrolase [Actinomycetota bacterium]
MTALMDTMTGVLPDMLSDVEQLIRCESPSSDAAAVARSADLVARIGAHRLGSAPARIDVDGTPHLRWSWGEGPARVLVLGHHDTVWPIGSLQTHPYEIREGIMRGPGCVDMKVGLVMAFHAIAALADRTGVTLLITGDEEVGSPNSRALIEAQAAGCVAALVLEAAADGGAVKTARKGVSRYDVGVIGRASHAGLAPRDGVNALVEMAHQVLAIQAMDDASNLGTTVTATVGSAGTATNTVPAQGRIAVDVRVWESSEQDRVDVAMHALMPVLPQASLQISGGPNRAPLERAMAAGLYDRAVVLARELGLPALQQARVGGASDGNFTAGVGVATLDGLGANGGGAHADDEHVIVADIPGRTALLTLLIMELLS